MLFGAQDSYLGIAVTNTKIFITNRSARLFSLVSTQSVRLPTGLHKVIMYPKVSVPGYSPGHFKRLPSRSVRYYALVKRWLLLSLRSDCFGEEHPLD